MIFFEIMPKITTFLLSVASIATLSTASAVVLIDISLDDANTTATQAVINFALSGDIDAGVTPLDFAENLLFLDLAGSPLVSQIVDGQNLLPAGNGLATVTSGLAPNNAFETRLSGAPRFGIAFSADLNAGSSFSGIATATVATTSLLDVDDFDSLDVFWSVALDQFGDAIAGPVVGATTVTPVPEASSFAAFAGISALGFLATRRRRS